MRGKLDFAVTVSILLAVFLLGYLFYIDVNSNFVSSTTPIGLIEFKYNTAQRNPETSHGWDKLRNGSVIYENDTVRTGRNSQAVVTFEDKTVINLADNTLVKISYLTASPVIDFKQGALNITASETGRALNVRAEGTDISLDSGTSLTMQQAGSETSISVNGGEATITVDGSAQRVGENVELRINALGAMDVFKREIIPLSPLAGYKQIAPSNNQAVRFMWKFAENQGNENVSMVIEAAKDRAFTTIQYSTEQYTRTESGFSAEMNVETGTWFWRVRTVSAQNQIITSTPYSFEIITERASAPISPADAEHFTYYTTLPVIDFLWSQSPSAGAYVLEVARNRDFSEKSIERRTAMNTLGVSELAAGEWYWRVVPQYPRGTVNTAQIPVRSFTVTQNNQVEPVHLLYPAEYAVFVAEKQQVPAMNFSWQLKTRTKQFRFLVSAHSQLERPLLTIETPDAYFSLSNAQKAALPTDTDLYWGVSWNYEGARYSTPTIRSFRVSSNRENKIEPQFPPENYRAASDVTESLRFTWRAKTPDAERIIFELSSDNAFSTLVYNTEVTENALNGLAKLKIGRYFWRLRAINSREENITVSEARSFDIVPPLAAPRPIFPLPQKIVTVGGEETFVVTFNAVPGADYYKVEIYADNAAEPTYRNNTLTQPRVLLPIPTKKLTQYQVRLQAFAFATTHSTRLFGERVDYNFTANRVVPILPVFPRNGGRVDGLANIEAGTAFRWQLPEGETASKTELIISKDTLGANRVLNIENPAQRQIISRIPPGTFYWFIKAHNADSENISSLPVSFTVLQAPPLTALTPLEPKTNTFFSLEYIRKTREIFFSWKPVPDATRYLVRIYNSNNNLLVSEYRENSTEYVLPDMQKLGRGTFYWNVEAQQIKQKDFVDRKSESADLTFTIDVPQAAVPVIIQPKGAMYGN